MSALEDRPGEESRRVIAKVARRLIPLLFACYVFSYLDRVNVGLAALTMNDDIGLSAQAFGWGAGLFFVGYVALEIPSNLMLHKLGARLWLSRILITWGLISAGTAFVSGPWSFAAARFLLGLAEAGFVPGVFLYLSYWFPARWRAQATGLFLLGSPAANVLGAPLAGLLFQLDGHVGLRGWQWLLIVEGLPATLLGFACLFFLPDSPKASTWLTAGERDWLEGELAKERGEIAARHVASLGAALTDRRVLLLALVNFCGIVGSVGIGLWLPQIVKGLGLTVLQTTLVAAIPYLCGGIAMAVAPRLIRSPSGRPWGVVFSLALAVTGLVSAALLNSPVATIAALCVAVMGVLSYQPNFWAIPSTFLTGRAAAGGLALMVAVGNVGGFVGPMLIGVVKERTGGFFWALLGVASIVFLGALLMAAVRDPRRFTRSPAGPVAHPEAAT